MGKEERTVKEISTKISFKDIVAFFGKLSNNTIEVIDPKIEKSFEKANIECKRLYKKLKDEKKKVRKRNNTPQLGDKVEIETKKVEGEILRNEEKSRE